MRLVRLTLFTVIVALIGAISVGAADRFPARIALPNGFAPEGIDIAPGGTFFVGSIPTGAIYRGDVKTGEGAVLVSAAAGRAAVGVDVEGSRIFVAGGPTGRAFVYDAENGSLLASYTLTTAPSFINDVVVTRTGAFFTDSTNPFLYRVPIGADGALGATAQAIPLTGDIVYGDGFNTNGIDATPDGKTLVIVQSNTGLLFTVDPATGVTDAIDLGGTLLPAGDGILLDGKTLYVVQNVLNRVAVVSLAPDLGSGQVVGERTSAALAVPTTIAEFGRRLYAVNARFDTPVTPDTEYWVTQLRK